MSTTQATPAAEQSSVAAKIDELVARGQEALTAFL